MIGDNENRQLYNARQYAGNLVALGKIPGATGVSWGEALAMLTSGPAKAFGMGDQIGSLKAGSHGDAVIWSGDPLELSSVPRRCGSMASRSRSRRRTSSAIGISTSIGVTFRRLIAGNSNDLPRTRGGSVCRNAFPFVAPAAIGTSRRMGERGFQKVSIR